MNYCDMEKEYWQSQNAYYKGEEDNLKGGKTVSEQKWQNEYQNYASS